MTFQSIILINILLLKLSFNNGINAQNHRYIDDYDPDYEFTSFEDRPRIGSDHLRNKYEQKISRLQEEIVLRNRYIARLERRVQIMYNRLRNVEHRREDVSGLVSNYAIPGSKTEFPHDTGEDRTNEEMMNQIIPEVSPRISSASCMRSCNYLKGVRGAADPLSQYMYLMVCAEGCRKTIPCINDNYCMPVMKENPGFFIQCVGKCELFKIAPKVFKSGRCK